MGNICLSAPVNQELVSQLYKAVADNDLVTLNTLLVNPEVTVRELNASSKEQEGRSPFYLACRDGKEGIVQRLLQDDRINFNQAADNGMTPFFSSCINKRTRIAELLLAHPHVKVNETDRTGETPFSAACRGGSLEVVKVLLNSERIKNIHKKENDGASPFYHACRNGHYEIAALLLTTQGLNPHEPTSAGFTPFYVACELGRDAIVKLILSGTQFDINYRCQGEYPSLYIACKKGRTEVVRTLLDCPDLILNTIVKDNNRVEWTSLSIACQQGHEEVVKLLLADSRCDPEIVSGNNSPLYIAAQTNQDKIFAMLLTHSRVKNLGDGFAGALNAKGESGKILSTLLARPDITSGMILGAIATWTVSEDHLGEALMLLNDARVKTEGKHNFLYGLCSAEVKYFYDGTCVASNKYLNNVVKEDNENIYKKVSLLLTCPDIDVNFPGEEGSPLMKACHGGNEGAVRALISHPRLKVNESNVFGTPLVSVCSFLSLAVFSYYQKFDLAASSPELQANLRAGKPSFYYHDSIIRILLTHPDLDLAGTAQAAINKLEEGSRQYNECQTLAFAIRNELSHRRAFGTPSVSMPRPCFSVVSQNKGIPAASRVIMEDEFSALHPDFREETKGETNITVLSLTENLQEQAQGLLTDGYAFSIQNRGDAVRIECTRIPTGALPRHTNLLLQTAVNSLRESLPQGTDVSKSERAITFHLSQGSTALFEALKKLHPSTPASGTAETNHKCVIS